VNLIMVRKNKRKQPSPKDKDYERMAGNIFVRNKWVRTQEDYELAFSKYMEDEDIPKDALEKLLQGSYKYFKLNMLAKGVDMPTFRKKARIDAIREAKREEKDNFRYSGIQKTGDVDVPERVVFARRVFITRKATGRKEARYIDAKGRYVSVPKHLRGDR